MLSLNHLGVLVEERTRARLRGGEAECVEQIDADLQNGWSSRGLQQFPIVTLNVLEPVTATQAVVRGTPLAAVQIQKEMLTY